MKIGIDARLINQTGVGVYIRNLLFYLQKLAPKDFEFYVYVPSGYNKFQVSGFRFQVRISDARWHSLNEQIGFYRQLVSDNLDLMHFTYFSYPLLYRRPFVITVHDLTPLLFKTGRASTRNPLIYNLKHLAYRYLLNQAINNSNGIITPTNSVKEEILQHYPSTDDKKVAVTYEGVDEELKKAKENTALSKEFKKPFFLYVGNFYPHKNVERLIEAFVKTKTDSHLVLVGPDDHFASQIIQLINQLNANSRVTLCHQSTLSDMVYIYKNARALIHPSLSEGFGLPIIEAAYFGLPIIASDIPVFREILGKDYISFDPRSVDDIAEKISNFIQGPTLLRSDLASIGRRFSFEDMAKKTLKVYKKSVSEM